MTRPGLYTHAKTGNTYRVLFTTRCATNGPRDGTIDVVYMDLKYGGLHTRSEEEFNERIEPHPKLGFNPGVKVPRFMFYSSGQAMSDADAAEMWDGLRATFNHNRRWLEGDATAILRPTPTKGIAIDPAGNFYFWDESGTGAYGPYLTEEEASLGVQHYASEL